MPGVLDKDKNLIKHLKVDEIRGLIADGTITGGMIPKVETCIYAIEQGRRGRRHPRRQDPACGADRTADRLRRRHADHPLTTPSRPRIRHCERSEAIHACLTSRLWTASSLRSSQ